MAVHSYLGDQAGFVLCKVSCCSAHSAEFAWAALDFVEGVQATAALVLVCDCLAVPLSLACDDATLPARVQHMWACAPYGMIS